jgi:hypothetical protein
VDSNARYVYLELGRFCVPSLACVVLIYSRLNNEPLFE